jgi:chloride channel 7
MATIVPPQSVELPTIKAQGVEVPQSKPPAATPPAESWYFNSRAVSMFFSFFWSIVIAFAVAVVAFIPTWFLSWANETKFMLFDKALESGGVGALLGANLLCAGLFVTLSAFIVAWWGGIIGGSGLPQVISYVSSGYAMDPQLFTLRTLVLNNISLYAAVIGGLAVGREGPLIRIGATTGLLVGKAILPVMQWAIEKYSWVKPHLKQLEVGDLTKSFSGEYDHEILHIGAAAGFAVAFNAPLGAMVYIYEEVASHWRMRDAMGGRMFFAVAVTIVFYKFFSASKEGTLADQSFNSVVVYNTSKYDIAHYWEYADVPFFLLLAICSGISNGYIAKWCLWAHRAHRTYVPGLWQKFFVAIGMGLITAFIYSIGPAIVPVCSPMPTSEQLLGDNSLRRFVPFGTCAGNTYNQLASLTLASTDDVVKHAFSRNGFEFDNQVLWFFLFMYAFAFIINMGAFTPGGNFVPNFIIGGVLGRIWGNIANNAYAGTGTVVSAPGVYAIIGATCQLSSWTRAMPGIVITMFEVTSDTSLSAPMIIASSIARSIANYFGEDGFAHMLWHSPHMKLPHHLVHPSQWPDPAKIEAKDRVATPPAGTGGHGSSHGGAAVSAATVAAPPVAPVSPVPAAVTTDVVNPIVLNP